MNNYKELKEKHQKEFNEFPMFFAFSNKQFSEAMKKIGLDPHKDTDKIYSFGAGGYYKKTDSGKLKELINRHKEEVKNAIESDKTGEGYIYQMFNYELGNHEYGWTKDLEDTLNALELTMEQINDHPALLNGLNKALENYEQI